MQLNPVVLSPLYRQAARDALVLQVLLAVLSLFVLDGGFFGKAFGIMLLGFWLGAAWIAVKRRWNPTPGDLLFLRFGALPCFALAFVLAQ